MSTDTVPSEPSSQVSSVNHKAANLGLILLLVAWLFSFFATRPLSSFGGVARQIGAYAPVVLYVGAMASGAVALIGIKRFGRKVLLWKGLVACLVPILLVLLAIPAFTKVKKISDDKRSAAVVVEINRFGHPLVRGGAQLDGAEVIPGEGVRIHLSMITWLRSEIDMKNWKNSVEPTIRQNFAQTPVAKLAQSGGRVVFVYHDMRGEEFDRRDYDGK